MLRCDVLFMLACDISKGVLFEVNICDRRCDEKLIKKYIHIYKIRIQEGICTLNTLRVVSIKAFFFLASIFYTNPIVQFPGTKTPLVYSFFSASLRGLLIEINSAFETPPINQN